MVGTTLYNEILLLPRFFDYPDREERARDSESIEKLLPDNEYGYPSQKVDSSGYSRTGGGGQGSKKGLLIQD